MDFLKKRSNVIRKWQNSNLVHLKLILKIKFNVNFQFNYNFLIMYVVLLLTNKSFKIKYYSFHTFIGQNYDQTENCLDVKNDPNSFCIKWVLKMYFIDMKFVCLKAESSNAPTYIFLGGIFCAVAESLGLRRRQKECLFFAVSPKLFAYQKEAFKQAVAAAEVGFIFRSFFLSLTRCVSRCTLFRPFDSSVYRLL